MPLPAIKLWLLICKAVTKRITHKDIQKSCFAFILCQQTCTTLKISYLFCNRSYVRQSNILKHQLYLRLNLS